MGSSAAAALVLQIRAGADPRRAERERRYLKSELVHLGVSVPKLRTAVKGFIRAHPEMSRADLIALVRELWSEPVHERRVASVELLILRADLLAVSDMRLVERLLRASKTWALVDPLAESVAGGLVVRYPALNATLDHWAADDDFWIRRSALLALLRPLRRGGGDFARFSRYADAMLGEKEFFIRKAIGWVLRETSKKQPGIVSEWLRPRAAHASGVTVREGAKYLPDAERNEIVSTYNAAQGRRSGGGLK